MSDFKPVDQQNEEITVIVNQDEFTIELQKYYSGHNKNSKKLEWTNQRIQSVIKLIDEYNSVKSQGKRATSKHYHHARKYDVMNVDNQKVLIIKRKDISDPVVQIIPTEEYYQKILDAHLATGHGRRDKIVHFLKDKYVVPIFAVSIFLNMCKTCLLKKRFPKKGIVVKPFISDDRRGQIDVVDFQTSPDQECKWLLQYQDPSVEERNYLVCNICNKESSGAHKCIKCKKIVHANCGVVSVENEGYESQLLCNLCVNKRNIVKDRTQSHINLKRAAVKMISTSFKKFKDISTGSTLLVEVPKVDSTNLVGKVLMKNNELYQVDTGLRMINDRMPRNAELLTEIPQVKASQLTATGPQDGYEPALWHLEMEPQAGPTGEEGEPSQDAGQEQNIQVKIELPNKDPLDNDDHEEYPRECKERKDSGETSSHSLMQPRATSVGIEHERRTSESCYDEIFGKSIGVQLRDVDKKQKVIAMKLISDAIYYANLGKLDENCFIQLGR